MFEGLDFFNGDISVFVIKYMRKLLRYFNFGTIDVVLTLVLEISRGEDVKCFFLKLHSSK